MNDHYLRRGRRLAVAAAIVLASACQAAPTPVPSAPTGPVSSPAPSASTATGPDAWAFADVAQPGAVTDAPSLQPGFHCSPCHPAAASQLFGVAPLPGGGFLGVGVQQPLPVATAVSSADGRTWATVDDWQPGDDTTAIAAASNGDRTAVVGSAASGAAAWLRTAAGWAAADPAGLEGPRGATAMTAVTAWGDGFLAGGYRDDPLQAEASAAAWRSTDGLTWQRDDDRGVFAGGRIWGIVARGDVAVAVGTSGDPSYGPAAAWALVGGRWRRATLADPGGVMRAVVATPTGFLAVGQTAADDGARVWRSSDGLTWTPVPDQGSFHSRSGPDRMQAVAVDDRGFVAGGWRADAGNGSTAAWESQDGEHWAAAPWVPAFSGGQIRGVALAPGLAIGVGRSGYPDNNQAAAWIRPRP